jgi:hypothetical protein
LARLTVGQRDALLMRLRERTFGRAIAGFAQCPRCDTRLQFTLDLDDYDVEGALARRLPPEEVLRLEGWELRFRLPTGRDLAAAARQPDEAGARRVLLERCVMGARREGEPVPPGELPEEVVAVVGARMEELDPLAWLSLAIDCARCGHQWLVLFDVAALLWSEIAGTAERLLGEVRALALAYGWSESEILAMSSARRRFYLQQVPSGGGGAAGGPARRRV